MYMSNRKPRKHFTAEQKVAIVREHLLEKVPISDLCDRHGMAPGLFYAWQKQLFEQGATAFERSGNGVERKLKKEIDKLEGRIRKKDEVIAEVTEEMVKLKKGNGEL
jgi:transposase